MTRHIALHQMRSNIAAPLLKLSGRYIHKGTDCDKIGEDRLVIQARIFRRRSRVGAVPSRSAPRSVFRAVSRGPYGTVTSGHGRVLSARITCTSLTR